jgi:hypothetical protein
MPRPDASALEEKKKENAVLAQVKLHSLTASPRSIPVFGKSTVSWNVTLPPAGPAVPVAMFLEGQSVASVGSRQVSPSFSKTFHLEAKGDLVARALGQTTVAVDPGTCHTLYISPDLVQAVVKSQLNTLLGGNSQITLRGDGTAVKLGHFGLTASVPLQISVPNWFDAKMDVSLKFSLFASDHVLAFIDNISVDVSWSIREHLASLGCTGVVQAALEIEATAFLQDLIGNKLAIELASSFQIQLNNEIAALHASHPGQHFKMHSMGVTEQGVSFQICPVRPSN